VGCYPPACFAPTPPPIALHEVLQYFPFTSISAHLMVTMPTKTLFELLPPFPNNVPIANIPRLSLNKLFANESFESERLYDACRTYGFFHLNLEGPSGGESLLKDAEAMYELDRRIHRLEQVEKMKYAYSPPSQLFG
jgi:hypothetical protein